MFNNSKKGKFFRNNELFSNTFHAIQIILYHDNFQVSNLLENKIKKLKTSTFYFVFGSISAKYGPRLKDIQLALLYPSALIEKYGYKEMLQPLIDDMKILETSSFWREKSQGSMNTFLGGFLIATGLFQKKKKVHDGLRIDVSGKKKNTGIFRFVTLPLEIPK